MELRARSQKTLRRKRSTDDGVIDDSVTRNIRHCGWVRYGPTVDVVVRGGKPSHEGVVTCGSVWSCPACSSAICAHRAEELSRGLAHARQRGWFMYLATFTVPHDVMNDLRPLFGLVAKGWQRMLAGKAWKKAQRVIGFEGYIRALECTTGRNGWHPHVHAILITRFELPAQLTQRELEHLPEPILARVRALRDETDDGRLADWRRPADEIDELDRAALAAKSYVLPQSIEGLRVWMWRRWARTVRRLGLASSPSLSNGVRIDTSNNAARYLTKMGLAREITVPAAKKGRGRNITHWQLLHRCNNGGGTAYDRARWQEWVEGSKGRKQLTYSKGLREKLGLGEELPDEQIAQDAAELERRLRIEGQTFDARLRWQTHKLRDLELAVAAGDTATMATILGPARGWSYSLPEDYVLLGGQEGRVESTGTPAIYNPLEPLSGADFDPVTGEVRSEHQASFNRSFLRQHRQWSQSRADKRREFEIRAVAKRLDDGRRKPEEPATASCRREAAGNQDP